jgi:hypothetical protein
VREFGLTPREAQALRRLTPPWKIQRFLDTLDYDIDGIGCRSPRRALRERMVQCMDGAMLGAAALRLTGHPPLILSLEGERDTDHVLAVFQLNGGWGALARSNFSGLRYREPVFRTIRELVLSYVESYFNLRREKTLRRYSQPVDMSRFDRRGWMTAEENLWYVPEFLCYIPHTRLLTRAQERALATVDRRFFEAGLVGRAL